MTPALANPFYYLANFQTVLSWVQTRYHDLLSPQEAGFITRFSDLPQPSRALLVRMIMRRGELFRASRLQYDEIGDPAAAAAPLAEAGWIDAQPLLTLPALFGLLTKVELGQILPLRKAASKADQLAELMDAYPAVRPFQEWAPNSDDCVWQLCITELCERLRLMFFGNAYQDWTEFVLADLGVFRYEKVAFPDAARAFQSRVDVDDTLFLHRLRCDFEAGLPVLDRLPAQPYANAWIERRRAKLRFQLARQLEQEGNLPAALALYADCAYPGARQRRIRVLECTDAFADAFAVATAAAAAPESEAEAQQLARMLPRLRRKLGLPKLSSTPPAVLEEITLCLARPTAEFYVEEVARLALNEIDGPVFYVENTLLNSLFGLLCWEAVFSPVPGAFFHPFQHGPADLMAGDFHQRRAALFERCLDQLEDGSYVDTIRRHFHAKAGLQSPFVFWGALSEELLELALHCIPAQHLRRCFERLLQDIKANRAGFPDLIQFWPQQRRYRMIEIKGPGDRLQDNQLRLLDYCQRHGIPVAVCYVSWQEPRA